MTSLARQEMHNRFFASTAPELNTASLMVTILELLRGDIPSVLKNFNRTTLRMRKQLKLKGLQRAANATGSEFLNVTFGWSPIIRDAANVLLVMLTLDRMVYSETNRRKRSFDGPFQETLVDGSGGPNWYPPLSFTTLGGTSTMLTSGQFFWTEKTLVKEDYRYSSRYSAIAKPNSRSAGFADQAEEILRRLGLVEDPTLLWELIPWSWLVDWCTNIGNSITAAHVYSPITGKHAVDYAYVTTQLTVQREVEVQRFVKQHNNSNVITEYTPLTKRGYFTSVSRTRDRATPFGFGTQLGSISSSQFAILVALGLAKSR